MRAILQQDTGEKRCGRKTAFENTHGLLMHAHACQVAPSPKASEYCQQEQQAEAFSRAAAVQRLNVRLTRHLGCCRRAHLQPYALHCTWCCALLHWCHTLLLECLGVPEVRGSVHTQLATERHSWFSHGHPGRAMNMQIASYTAVVEIAALPPQQCTASHGLINGCAVDWQHRDHTR